MMADILLLHFGHRARDSSRQYHNSSSVIEACLQKAQELLIESGDSPHREGINEIVEMLKYSNRTKLCGSEMDLLSKLERLPELLQKESETDAKDAVKEIQNMVKMRSIQIKTSGKF